MRDPEGIAALLTAMSSERPWSEGRNRYIRNVEAEGSSPFTSTKGPGQLAAVEPEESPTKKTVESP